MPHPARLLDSCSHPSPGVLFPGKGSQTVLIGFLPAWRALPHEVGTALYSLSLTMESLLLEPTLNLATAQQKLAEMKDGMAALGQATSAQVTTASTSAATALDAENTKLSAAWTSASSQPGGQPAADAAYTKGIQAAAAAAATAAVSAMAGAGPDLHSCFTPVPPTPHGPGFVMYGSPTVKVNGFPLAREGDIVAEACGGSNPITKGCQTVNIDAGPGEKNYAGKWDILFFAGGGPMVFGSIKDLMSDTYEWTCRGKPLYGQENGTSCAQASAKMIIDDKHGRGTVTEEQLRDESKGRGGYDPRNGTHQTDIPRMLNNHGVPIDPAAGGGSGVDEVNDVHSVESATAGGKSAVLNVGEPNHYVVVDGVVERDGKKYMQIRDPAYPGGAGCREIEVGGNEWNERVRNGASIVPQG